ncbi:MAG: YbhN family protein [Acidimicrobiales bacterium]
MAADRADGSGRSRTLRQWAGRLVLLAIGAATLYGLAPQIFDVWGQVPELRALGWIGLVAMVACELISFACAWGLHRVALPGLSWYAAGTTQLTSNAVSRAVPGGAAMGAGVSVKMWTIAGVDLGNAAGALAATSLISTATLFLLPFVALCVAAFGAPVPRNLALVAGGAGILAALLFGLGTLLMASEGVAAAVARFASRTSAAVACRIGREGLDCDEVMARRAELVDALGERWHAALGWAVGNWTFDYAALAAAVLILEDSRPRFGLVLMAYGAAAVLAMIPITPGGLGFVEAGLASLLTLAGIPATDALLATLAYRIVSFWLPLALGPVAWLAFQRHYHQRVDLEELPEVPASAA